MPVALEAELGERLRRSRRRPRRAARRGRGRSRGRSRARRARAPGPRARRSARRRRRGARARARRAASASAASRSLTRRITATSAPGSRGPSAANSVSLKRRASAPTSVNFVRALDHVHAEVVAGEIGDRVAVGDPERDVVERGDGEWGGHSLHATHPAHATMCAMSLVVGPRAAADQARARLHRRDGGAARRRERDAVAAERRQPRPRDRRRARGARRRRRRARARRRARRGA